MTDRGQGCDNGSALTLPPARPHRPLLTPGLAARDLALLALAYAAALLAGLGASHAIEGWPLIPALAAANAAATLVLFGFSAALANPGIYELYWSLMPMALALALAMGPGAEGTPWARRVAVVVLVFAWGARLSWNALRRWPGLHHEDWRYRDLRRRAGRAWWLVNLFALHLLPTALVFLGCLPLLPALRTGARPLSALDALAFAWITAFIAIEAVADQQLHRYRRQDPSARPPFLATGLWSRVRHPNYLGEMGFFWGLYLAGLAADPSTLWPGIGALFISALFVFGTIPMMDRRLDAKPGYREHRARVPALLPRLRPPPRD